MAGRAGKSVPTIDVAGKADPAGFTAFELRTLDADAKAKENINREADQRYYLRWGAVALCIAVVIGMSTMLYHVGYYMLTKPVRDVPAAFLVAIYVAPIVSMSRPNSVNDDPFSRAPSCSLSRVQRW